MFFSSLLAMLFYMENNSRQPGFMLISIVGEFRQQPKRAARGMFRLQTRQVVTFVLCLIGTKKNRCRQRKKIRTPFH
jgi:hypothetical protein